MKNPLNRRYKRELLQDFGKYLVIFLFLGGVIAFVSGFLVANDSMTQAYNESFEKYKIEDGNFELAEEADEELLGELEKEGVTIYPNAYLEESTKEVDSTLRIFAKRDKVNLECLMEGEFPKQSDEIAIDRMYADNNELKPGDSITVGDKKFTITGLVALSDYSALFSNTSDMMFDAVKFGVAIVTEDVFHSFTDTHLHYSYSWVYDNEPKDDAQAKTMAEDFMKAIAGKAELKQYIPQYLNQAIHFTGDDMTGDNAMITTFLYIVIVIIAFVIAITTSNTISKEAAVIGTLRASGYTKKELVSHYMMLPVLIMIAAAVVGNILGYSILKDYMAGMYYGSYSLPTYVTRWNGDAFIKTTIVPLVIMVAVNLIILVHKIQLSPLQFLRRNLSGKQKKKVWKLNGKIPFFKRFQIRVLFQNMPNYFMILVGIFFANFILMFGLMFSPLLDKFSDDIVTNMIADYQYVLKAPVETTNEAAEKYLVSTLKTIPGKLKSEEVMVYGVQEDSAFVNVKLKGKGIYVSNAYADKFQLEVGDTIQLDAQYEEKDYEFTIEGIYEYPSSIAIFMNEDTYYDTFDVEEGSFNGYFSDEELKDIPENAIATIITLDDLTKTSRQLKISMGRMMIIFQVFGVVMCTLIIYLLSKIIIEKNTLPISMTKILGYLNPEINRLYIMPTTFFVIASLIGTLPVCYFILKKICIQIFADYSGYFPFYVPGSTFLKMFALGAIAYAVVGVFQIHKVKKIPMGEALKNVE